MSLKGSLESFSLGEIFQSLSINQHTGTLKIHDGEVQKLIYFTNGRIIHLSTGRRDDFRLGDMLSWSGVIGPDQLDEAQKEQKSTGRRLGEILIERGWAREDDIEQMVVKNIEEEIYDLFLWKKADFEFIVDYFPEEFLDPDQVATKVQLSTNSLIMEALRRIDEWAVIRERISTLKAIFTVASPPLGLDRMSGIDLPDVVKREIHLVDGRRNVAEIVSLSPASKFEICKLLYELLTRDLIRPMNIQELIALAEEQFADGQFGEARKYLEFAVDQDPKNPDLHLQLADAFEHTASDRQAVEQYTKAAKLHEEQGEPEMTVVAYRKALELDPRNPEIMEMLFDALIEADKLVQAQGLGLELGELLRESLQFAKAVRVYAKLVEKDPKETSVRLLLAAACKGMGDVERALEEYNIVADQLEREMRFTDLERVYRILKALATKDEDLLKIRQKYDRIEKRRLSAQRRKKVRFYGVLVVVVLVLVGGGLEFWAYNVYQGIAWPGAFVVYKNQGYSLHAVWEMVEKERGNKEKYQEYARTYREWDKPDGEFKRAFTALDGFQKKHVVSIRFLFFARKDRAALDDLQREIHKRANWLSGEYSAMIAERREGEATRLLENSETDLRQGLFEEAFKKRMQIWSDEAFATTEVRRGLTIPFRVTTDPHGARIYVNGAEVEIYADYEKRERLERTPRGPCLALFRPSGEGKVFTVTADRKGYRPAKTEARLLDGFQDLRLVLERDTVGILTVDGAVHGRPLEHDGYIYFCSRGRTKGAYVYRFKGRVPTAYPMSAIGGRLQPPIVHQGTLVVGSDDGRLWRLTEPRKELAAISGENTRVSLPITGGPTALPASPMIYFGAYDGRVFRLDTSVVDAAPQVIYRGEDEITSVVAIRSPDPGRGSAWLLLGSLDEHVRIIRGDTGEGIWEQAVGGDVVAPPEVEDGQVIVGTTGGSLFVLALDDGSLLHHVNLPGSILSLEVQDAIAFVGIGGEKPGVMALALPNLEPLWEDGAAYQTLGNPDTGILIEEGFVIFGDDSGRLTVLQAATGEMVWDFQAKGAITALPVVMDGEVYAGDAFGTISILSLRLDP